MWSTTIRTGNPEADQRALDQHRAQAHQQGLVLHVQALPQGGYYVQALPPQGAPPVDPGAQFGGTLPSAPGRHLQRPPSQPPPHGSPVPAPVMIGSPMDADAQFGGTLPSKPQGYAARIQPTPQIEMHPSAQYAGLGRCQSCGREGPTKELTFMQNVGVLVIRFPKTVGGHLCKFCVDRLFFSMTLITFFFGWWGVISFFYTLVALPVNVVNRLRAIGMAYPRHDADSLAGVRARGTWLIVMGVLVGIVAGLKDLLFVATLLTNPDAEVVAILVTLVVTGLFLDLPAILLVVFGARARLAAARAAKELGLA